MESIVIWLGHIAATAKLVSWALGAIKRRPRLRYVFGNALAEDVPLTIVVSARNVRDYQGPRGFTFDYRKDEGGVTNTKDVEGLGKLLSFFGLEGKTENLNIRFAGGIDDDRAISTITDEDRKGALFLMGSPVSNRVTEMYEKRGAFGKYCFGENYTAIIDKETNTPYRREIEDDYAILAKWVDEQNKIRLIAAGIGPSGTAGATIFLTEPVNYTRIAKKYKKGPFSILLRVRDGDIYNATTVPEDLLR